MYYCMQCEGRINKWDEGIYFLLERVMLIFLDFLFSNDLLINRNILYNFYNYFFGY